MFSIYSRKQLKVAETYAIKSLESKNLQLGWDLVFLLFLWKVFNRKKYVVCLLLYIRGKFIDIYEPTIVVNNMTTKQLESKLRINNWTWKNARHVARNMG